MENISSKEVITRKDHKCWACGLLIEKGTKCQTQTNTDQGEIYTIYAHKKCYEICLEFYEDYTYYENHDEFTFRIEMLGLSQ